MEDIFCWQEDRTLSDNLTLQYDKRKYIIEDRIENRQLRRRCVTVYDYYDGSIKIKYEKKELHYHSVFDKLQRVSEQAIIDNKRLGAALAYIKEKQDKREKEERSMSCPKRKLKINQFLWSSFSLVSKHSIVLSFLLLRAQFLDLLFLS